MLVCLVLGDFLAHVGVLLVGAGRTAHEAADTVKQGGQEAAHFFGAYSSMYSSGDMYSPGDIAYRCWSHSA